MAEQRISAYRAKLIEMDGDLDVEASGSFEDAADMLVQKQRQEAENSYLTSLVVKVRPCHWFVPHLLRPHVQLNVDVVTRSRMQRSHTRRGSSVACSWSNPFVVIAARDEPHGGLVCCTVDCF